MPIVDVPIVKPDAVFIEDLLDELNTGKLRIPNFQRPFVWKPLDMLALFDSIYKGYPIGSLLFWESKEQVESRDDVGPIEVPLNFFRIYRACETYRVLCHDCTGSLIILPNIPTKTTTQICQD